MSVIKSYLQHVLNSKLTFIFFIFYLLQVQELIELCQGSKAFYGYTPRHWSQQSHVGGHDTLYSLVLSMLPLHSNYALHCNFDEYNCVHMPVVNETDPEWLKNNFSTNVVGTIVKVLKEKAGFFLPEVSFIL